MHVIDSNQRVEFLELAYFFGIRYRGRVTTITASPPTPVCVESLADVQVRLALPTERLRWDEQMRAHHFLGFKQFAGRGLRYVAEYRGRWVAVLGWQTGAFQCGPRDRWLGWPKHLQFQRLHLIANNTRFLILPGVSGTRNPGSLALGANLRRPSRLAGRVGPRLGNGRGLR